MHAGRDPTPSATIIDSQSIKMHQRGLRGFVGAKKVAGRQVTQRHMLVDTQGNLLLVVVHPANVYDRYRDGGRLVLEAAAEAFPRLQRIWADNATLLVWHYRRREAFSHGF